MNCNGLAQGLDLVLARCIGQEIQSDGAVRLRFSHRGIVAVTGEAFGLGASKLKPKGSSKSIPARTVFAEFAAP